MRTMALPSVNQDHSDGAPALGGGDTLAARGTPPTAGSPAPPLRTGDRGAGITEDGVAAIGSTASPETVASLVGAAPAADALLPAVTPGSAVPERASAASSAAT